MNEEIEILDYKDNSLKKEETINIEKKEDNNKEYAIVITLFILTIIAVIYMITIMC